MKLTLCKRFTQGWLLAVISTTAIVVSASAGEMGGWDQDTGSWTTTLTDSDPISSGAAVWGKAPALAVDSSGNVYYAIAYSSHMYLARYNGTAIQIWDRDTNSWTTTLADGDTIDNGTTATISSYTMAIDATDNVYIAFCQRDGLEHIYLVRYDGTDCRIWDQDTSGWTTNFGDGDPIDIGADDATSPAIAIDSSGKVYVAFRQALVGLGAHRLYLTRYNGTNVEVWDNDTAGWSATLSDGDPIDQGVDEYVASPRLAIDSADRVYILFCQRTDGATYRPLLSRYDGTSVAIWDTDTSSWTTTFTDGDHIDNGLNQEVSLPNITVDAMDRVYIGYKQSDGTRWRAYLSRFDGTDVRIWDHDTMSWTTVFTDGDPIDHGPAYLVKSSPEMIPDSLGNVYICYGQTTSTETHMYLNRCTGTEVAIWDNGASRWSTRLSDGDPIDIVGASIHGSPTIAMGDDQNLYISYMYRFNDTYRILMSRYDGSDVGVWDHDAGRWTDTFADGDPVDNGLDLPAKYPAMVADASGHAFLAFVQENGVEDRIYTTRYLNREPPTISTTAANNASATSFDSGGNVTDAGYDAVTARGLCWNTTGSPTTGDNVIDGGTGTGTFVSNVSGLTAGTMYYFRAYATNSLGTSYGLQRCIRTPADPAVTSHRWPETRPLGDTDQWWTAAAISGDGQVVFAGVQNGRMYKSANGGSTWTEVQPAGNNNVDWKFATCSADGSHVMVGGTNLDFFVSTNGGATWTRRIWQNGPWQTGSCSVDGQVMIAGRNTGLHASWDGGTNWQELEPAGSLNKNWRCTAISGDGQIMFAGAAGGRLYYSTRPGTWRETQPAGDTDQAWQALDMAADAETILAAVFQGRLYRSTNGGSSWAEVQPAGDSDQDWQTVTVSDDGQVMAAAATPGRVYISVDRGTTWSETYPVGDANGNWYQLNASISGQHIIAADYTRRLYIGAPPTLPTVTTTAASNVGRSTADSGGNVTSDGGLTTTRGVCWNTTGSPTISDSKTSDGTGTGSFVSNLTGLNHGVTYHVRAYATNALGTAYGNEIQLTTTQLTGVNLVTNPGAETGDMTGWTIVANGGSGWSSGTYSPRTDARSFATSSAWCSRTQVIDLVAAGFTAAELDQQPEIRCSEWIRSRHDAASEYYIEFSLLDGTMTPIDTYANGSDASPVALAADTAWFEESHSFTGYGSGVRYVKILDAGKDQAAAVGYYGTHFDDASVTVHKAVATLTTTAASAIATTSLSTGGNISADGSASVTARGVCWNTTGAPTIADDKTSDGSGTGSFTSSLSGLSGSTTYYIRAYATNSVGTSYGNQITATTAAAPSPPPPADDEQDGDDGTGEGEVPPQPDIHVQVSAPSETAKVNEQLTFNVSLENRGTGSASNVQLRFPLPPNTEFVGAWLIQQQAGQSVPLDARVEGDEIVIVLGSVAAAEARQIELVLKARNTGDISLEGSISTDEQGESTEVESDSQVKVEDVHWEVVTTTVPVNACGAVGASQLLMTLCLLGLIRRQGRV